MASTASDIWFDPDSREFIDDPYPFYRELRDRAPVYRHPETGLYLITRYADVERATTDHAVFSSAGGNVIHDSPTRVGKTLGSLDPPRHDELRRVVQRGLGTARIERILPSVRADVRARLEALKGQRECDFVADFSKPVLFGALRELLGLSAEESREAAELIETLFHQGDGAFGSILPPELFRAVADFLSGQVQRREADRGDDVISALLDARDAGAPLAVEEIVANASTVLMAGNASIGHFFPNLIHALWRHPDQRRLVLDDPGRIPAAIEEGVRWDTSTQCFARQIERDVTLSGTMIPAGSRAVIFYASANRDERAIEDPDRFDVGRKRIRHFGFGMGAHVCAGANASRAILRTILEELLSALGEYELDPCRATRASHIMVRGFRSLPIRW